ncbi:MAG: c-type cytochrome [Dechloromonas sp.]|nr:c-type cytochrome [Dechloromonas sp.]
MTKIPALALLLLGATPALAADKVAAPQPYFVANCFNCHGTEGRTHSAIPAIAGRDRTYLEETLKSFKAGSKPATIMHQLAKGYTDDEIVVLADYFSRQK